jgi:ADP-dependent NAD(P)H-hydrate dehydratase / NAD(P)H-hydrate epimerase
LKWSGIAFQALDSLVNRYAATVVLKGAGTLVGAPDWPLHVCDAGNPGMAVAGMGDVLAGLIAALRAQGLETRDAAAAGVWLHAVRRRSGGPRTGHAGHATHRSAGSPAASRQSA